MACLICESTAAWGGNTAMSGGGMWLPNNPLMQRDGVGDSRDEALDYLERTAGTEGAATSRARKEAFVDGVADAWADAGMTPRPYPAGSWGPAGAFALIERTGRAWND